MIKWQTIGQFLGEAHYASLSDGTLLYVSPEIDKRSGEPVGWRLHVNNDEIASFATLDAAKDAALARNKKAAEGETPAAF